MSVNTHPVDQRQDVRVMQQSGVERREVVTEDVNAQRLLMLERVSALVAFLFSALEGLIGLRVLLKLMEANPRNAFASSIYNLTSLFLAPFSGLTSNPAANGIVLEITSIVAMIAYALLAWAIIRLVWLIFYQPSNRTIATYERERSRRDDNRPSMEK